MTIKTSLRVAALSTLLPSTALAWGLVVPTGSEGPPCVDVLEHAVEVTASIAGASSSISMLFEHQGGPATILLPQIGGTPVTASLDGGDLMLTRLGEADGLERLVALAAARGTPRLIDAGGRPLALAEVQLSAGSHVLEIASAPIVDWSADTPRIVQPIKHLGTACRTPEVGVNMTLSTPVAVGAVFAPFHDPVITRTAMDAVDVSIRAPANQQCHDAVVFLSTAERVVSANVLTYRAPACDAAIDDNPGYLLLATGATPMESEEAVAKDIALVIDTSGSMGGDKIASVRRALSSILGSLRGGDRFDLITFSGAASSHFGALASADDGAALASARTLAEGLIANGSTNIHEGLLTALRELGADGADRPKLVLFLTDGQATAGITDTNRILADVAAMNEIGARIFSFGVGFDVNTTLLDELSRQTAASTHYIRPGDDIDGILASFYREVSAPIATDLSLVTDQITVRDRYPEQLPDLFVGSQILALARYDDSSSAGLAVSARTGVGMEAFDVAGAVVRSGTEHPFLPRLWASRRLGQLLYEARHNGGEEATVEEIRGLALHFGFVTRFTPFRLDEAGALQREYDDPTAASSGQEAVETSGYINDLSGNSNAAGYSGGEAAPIAQVLDRTFILDGGYWTDTTAPEDVEAADPIDLEYMGHDWLAMVAASPTARALLSVGPQVVLTWRCTLIRVTDPRINETPPAFEPVPNALLEPDPGAQRMPIPALPVDVLGPDRGTPPTGAAGPGATGGEAGKLPEAAPSCASTGGAAPSALLLVLMIGLLAQRRRRQYR